jgi:hypothetical protein
MRYIYIFLCEFWIISGNALSRELLKKADEGMSFFYADAVISLYLVYQKLVNYN